MTTVKEKYFGSGGLKLLYQFKNGTARDYSISSYNGTISGAQWTDSERGRSLRFDGDNDYVTVGDITALNSATSFTLSFLFKQKAYSTLDNIFSKLIDANNKIAVYTTAANLFVVDVNNGSASYGYFDRSSVIPTNEYVNVVIVFNGNGVANSDRLKVFINGMLQTLSFSGTIPAITANLAGASAIVGSATNSLDGHIGEVIVFNTNLSNLEVATLYQENFLEPRTTSSTGVFAFFPNLTTDADMESSSTTDWTEYTYGSPTVTKQTGGPRGSSKCLRVAYTATINPIAGQTILRGSRTYRVRGWARGDGTRFPSVWISNGTTYDWLGTAENTWQYFDVKATNSGTLNTIYLMTHANGAGYSEFDEIFLEEYGPRDSRLCTNGLKWNVGTLFGGTVGSYVSNTAFKVIGTTGRWSIVDSNWIGGTKYLQQTASSGVVAIPSNQTVGKWEFKLYKGSDSAAPEILFMASKDASRNTSGQNGYALSLTSGVGNVNRVRIYRITNGGVVYPFQSAENYVSSGTWYNFRILRNANGKFYVYIKGGAYTTWTLVSTVYGANPFTDNTHTVSNYLVFDVDQNDAITDIIVSPQRDQSI